MNYEHLLKLNKQNELKDEFALRFKRLLGGYHIIQLMFEKIVKPAYQIADVGAYYADLSYPLLEKCKEVTFIDYQDDKFPYIKSIIPPGNAPQFIKHDLAEQALESTKEKFDVILCMEVMHYIPSAKSETFLKNMLATLKVGGYLVIDLREPSKTYSFYQYVLAKPTCLLVLLEPLRKWMRIIKRFVKKMIKGSHAVLPYEQKIEELCQKFNLKKLPVEKYIDLELYTLLRNMQGYNITNTHVGNYLNLMLFQKES